jgi:hypothetical protein
MLQDIPEHEVKQSFFAHKVANLPASAHCHEIIVFENDQFL